MKEFLPFKIGSRFKQLGKDSLIYGIGGIAARGIGFLLLPIYTRIFTPADYGVITMLQVIKDFLSMIVVMGMDAAQTFYFFEQREKGEIAQMKVVSSIFQWKLIWGVLILGVALLVSPVLNAGFFARQLTWHYFAIAFTWCLFASIASQSAELFRLLYRPLGFISVNLGITVLSAGIALVCILGFRWGLLGFFAGSATGTLIMAIIGWWPNRVYLDLSRWHSDWWPRLVRFGTPFIPEALAMYILNASDRWFINYYYGQEAIGLYAVGAKFAMLIALAVTTFRQAWWPVAMEAMHASDGPLLFKIIARLYLGIGAAGVVLLTAFSPLLVNWFTAPAFRSAYPIVGILAWHSLFYGFYLIAGAGIWKKEKVSWLPVLMGIAALLNIVLDALFVPKYGSIGAAIATSFSFFIWNVLTLIVSERLWPVGYSFRIFGLQISIGVIACCTILLIYHKGIPVWNVMPVTFGTIAILSILSVNREWLVKMINPYIKK